jgi:hypothetical protein
LGPSPRMAARSQRRLSTASRAGAMSGDDVADPPCPSPDYRRVRVRRRRLHRPQRRPGPRPATPTTTSAPRTAPPTPPTRSSPRPHPAPRRLYFATPQASMRYLAVAGRAGCCWIAAKAAPRSQPARPYALIALATAPPATFGGGCGRAFGPPGAVGAGEPDISVAISTPVDQSAGCHEVTRTRAGSRFPVRHRPRRSVGH